ncbi:MAG: MBL fold metallo-hydrolase [Acidobacteria bacterium]|nr:MBL fold metallo-hydrolase [Acidobacteriota bacterium]
MTAAQEPDVAQPPAWNPNQQRAKHGGVVVLPVQGNVYVLAADGANITVQVGRDGILLVDASTGQMNDDILAAIRGLSNQPIRWVINTHVHGDHTGGNEAIFRAGSAMPQNRIGSGLNFPGSLPSGAVIVSNETVLLRMSGVTGGQPLAPQAAWPTLTYIGQGRELYVNGEPIQVLHQPNAHTDGDSLVVFRHSDVVSTGDVFSTISYPVIDLETGGSINGMIDALNGVLGVTFPAEKQEGGTYVIPGHGRIADEADVVAYRNMVTVIRDRIQDLKDKGMTLEQVKAVKPTLDYDRRWATASWTGDMFVEAVYRTLPPSLATAQR